MTTDRTARVQGLRRSNAATPHGTGRRPAPDMRQAILDSYEADRCPDCTARGGGHLRWCRGTALDREAAGAEHVATYDTDYGTRFLCSCGEVSPYWSSRKAAEEAHAAHAAGNDHPRTSRTEPVDN